MTGPAQASDVTGCGLGMLPVSCPVARFHISTRSSLLPAAIECPSGLNETAFTQSLAPARVVSSFGRADWVTFHSHTLWS